jgi:hypothetical protein
MHNIIQNTVIVLGFMLGLCGSAHAVETVTNENKETSGLQQRIDFGNAYIMGQSIKSGSVYLLHRKKSDIDSMLKIRTDFRKEIIEDFELGGTELVVEGAETAE